MGGKGGPLTVNSLCCKHIFVETVLYCLMCASASVWLVGVHCICGVQRADKTERCRLIYFLLTVWYMFLRGYKVLFMTQLWQIMLPDGNFLADLHWNCYCYLMGHGFFLLHVFFFVKSIGFPLNINPHNKFFSQLVNQMIYIVWMNLYFIYDQLFKFINIWKKFLMFYWNKVIMSIHFCSQLYYETGYIHN